MRFGLLGGDLRQLKLAEWLAAGGHQTAVWGLEKEDSPYHTNLDAALAADCVILPLPVSQDGELLYMPLSQETMPLETLWPRLGTNQLLCGGNIAPALAQAASDQGLTLTDYFQREDVQVGNAVATAEGALQRAMEETETTLHRRDCLVLGFGRIGKILAHRLTGLGAYVTVFARKAADLAWIEAMDYEPLRPGELATRLGDFQILFNTVPAKLLGEPELALLRPDCLLVDLASPPGGVDRQAAERLGVKTLWARSLPGLVAPRTAAEIIGRAIYTILEERIQ